MTPRETLTAAALATGEWASINLDDAHHNPWAVALVAMETYADQVRRVVREEDAAVADTRAREFRDMIPLVKKARLSAAVCDDLAVLIRALNGAGEGRSADPHPAPSPPTWESEVNKDRAARDARLSR